MAREVSEDTRRIARRLAVERVLDTPTVTRRRKFAWGLAAAGIGLDGYDLFIMSAAGPLIVASLDLAPWQKAVAVGAAVLGAVPGALFGGRLADRFGRQTMLKVDLFIFIGTAIASAFAWDVWSLALFRFLQGMAVGAEYPLSASMVSEVMPAATRGRWMTGAFAFQAVGMVAAAGVATLLLLAIDDVDAWRWMLLSGVIPAVVVAIMRLKIPESPRWEARQGNLEEAERGAEWMTGIKPEVTDDDIALAEVFDRGPQPRIGAKALFMPRFRRALVLTTVPWFLMDIALYGVGLFTPTLIMGLVQKSPDSTFLADDLIATAESAFTDVFLVIGFLINIVLIERAGRIRLQSVGFVGMAVGLAILALSGDGGAAWLILLGFSVFNIMLNIGPNATTYLLPTEVYPTRLRATGHGVAASAGKVGAVIGTFGLPLAVAAYGIRPTMVVIAVLSLVGLLVTLAARIETTGRVLVDEEA